MKNIPSNRFETSQITRRNTEPHNHRIRITRRNSEPNISFLQGAEIRQSTEELNTNTALPLQVLQVEYADLIKMIKTRNNLLERTIKGGHLKMQVGIGNLIPSSEETSLEFTSSFELDVISAPSTTMVQANLVSSLGMATTLPLSTEYRSSIRAEIQATGVSLSVISELRVRCASENKLYDEVDYSKFFNSLFGVNVRTGGSVSQRRGFIWLPAKNSFRLSLVSFLLFFGQGLGQTLGSTLSCFSLMPGVGASFGGYLGGSFMTALMTRIPYLCPDRTLLLPEINEMDMDMDFLSVDTRYHMPMGHFIGGRITTGLTSRKEEFAQIPSSASNLSPRERKKVLIAQKIDALQQKLDKRKEDDANFRKRGFSVSDEESEPQERGQRPLLRFTAAPPVPPPKQRRSDLNE